MDTYTNIKTEEKWIPCYGFEDKLLVRQDKTSVIILNYNKTKKNVEKECTLTPDGHLQIGIGYKGRKVTIPLQKAIYETYKQCSIPDGYDIHHKDFNPLNNSIDNLLLISHSEHKTLHNILNNPKELKPVVQYNLKGEFVSEYASICEAEKKTGISKGCISKCCKNKRKTAGGFIWKYK